MRLFKPFFNFLIHLLTRLDSQVFEPLRTHEGKIIGFELSELNHTLYFQITEDKLIYLPELPENDHVDTLISGRMSDFFNLWQNAKNPSRSNSKIHIHGDMSLAESLNRVFAELDIDWEEKMARVLGDALAFQLTEVVKETRQWSKSKITQYQEDITDYLQNEKKILPTQIEVDAFCRKVDEIRDDVERLEARILKIESH